MKLNNKGFAITGILYTILILFLFALSSLLLTMSTKLNRSIKLTNNIYSSVENKNEISYIDDENNYIDTNNNYFVAQYRGKYEFVINDGVECFAYFPEDSIILIKNNKIYYKKANNIEPSSINVNDINDLTELVISDCNNSNVNNVTFTKVYTSMKG